MKHPTLSRISLTSFFTLRYTESVKNCVLFDRGRFSVVSQCEDSRSSQMFAAKMTAYRPEQRQQVLREYQLLRRLSHPHLVQLQSAILTPTCLVLIEELCPGRELLYNLSER